MTLDQTEAEITIEHLDIEALKASIPTMTREERLHWHAVKTLVVEGTMAAAKEWVNFLPMYVCAIWVSLQLDEMVFIQDEDFEKIKDDAASMTMGMYAVYRAQHG